MKRKNNMFSKTWPCNFSRCQGSQGRHYSWQICI